MKAKIPDNTTPNSHVNKPFRRLIIIPTFHFAPQIKNIE